MIRPEVSELQKLGPLPNVDTITEDEINAYEHLIDRITAPLSDEEACALASLLGPDDCFGLAWSLVHLIETSPNWLSGDCLPDSHTAWGETLRTRIRNARA